MSAIPSWQERVVDRSVKRSAEAARTRAIGPTQQIVDAALEFGMKEGSTFTLTAVLKRAGVSVQTFYRHFSGKDELLLAVIEELVREGAARFAAQAESVTEPVRRLKIIITAPVLTIADGLPSHALVVAREHLRLMEHYPREIENADAPYRNLVAEAIIGAKAAGNYPGVDPDMAADMVLALVLARYHTAVLAVGSLDPADEAENIWDFCHAAMQGITTRPKSRKATSRR